jgi:hypothetical protein
MWFSSTNADTAFGLDSDDLMSHECSNLSDLAFEMELDIEAMSDASPSHASFWSETSSASSSPLRSTLPKSSIHLIKHQTAREEKARETSPTDVMSTFSAMESKLESLRLSQKYAPQPVMRGVHT